MIFGGSQFNYVFRKGDLICPKNRLLIKYGMPSWMVNSVGIKTVNDMEYFQQSIAVKIVTPRLMELEYGMRVGLVEVNLPETLVFAISEWGFASSTRAVLNWKFQCSL